MKNKIVTNLLTATGAAKDNTLVTQNKHPDKSNRNIYFI